jgi:hypothetical protein
MNNTHLSDKEIHSMIIEPETVDKDLQLHLKKCQHCRKRLNRIKAFTKAFQEQVEHTEINWAIEKGRIISIISDYRMPVIWGRWATAVIISFILITSAFLLRQLYIQPNNDIKTEEIELLQEIRIFTEVRGEVELPQSILFLAEWEREDFRQFLNFFSPIEEESDEKKDFINDSLGNNRGELFLFA